MELEIRRGDYRDAEAFLSLLREVRQTMLHPEWFFLDPDDVVREMLRDGRMQLWVAMDGDRLAGAFDYITPGLDESSYGWDLGLSAEELPRVVNFDSVAVRPEYRGMGLQRKLMACAEDALSMDGPRILLCTIHPDNRFSLQNAQRRGFEVVAKLPKYGSVRLFLRKDIP